MNFPISYEQILKRIRDINPISYAKTRNHLSGSVTHLSPYITRGVISLAQVRDIVLEKYSKKDAAKLLQELAWREYFQKVRQAKGEDIFSDMRFPQPGVKMTSAMPQSVIDSKTGITILDTAISNLYSSGYMHNHARMWVAAAVTNLAKCSWLPGSRWMYYHLLDGDLASNSLSWQWVSGAFASKQYVAHQELLNACSPKNQSQHGTFLDIPREDLLEMKIPSALEKTIDPSLPMFLPDGDNVSIQEKNVVLYHPWCLDPTYRADISAQRILIIEPSHFSRFPVSKKVMDFIVSLAKENIPGVEVYVGEFSELMKHSESAAYYQYHKNVEHFTGIKDVQEELFPEVQGYHKSFFSFWKECEKQQR